MSEKKILIVDFDTESLAALSNLVYEEGFQAETATDGLTAYEKFRNGQFDLVILEPMLPKLHGFELCKKIVGDPERNVPVIIVTAIYREPSCKHDALTVIGAAAFFTKPYSREELRSKMLQLLVERQDPTGKKAAEPAVHPAAARASMPGPAPVAPAGTKPPRLDLRDLLGTKPVSKETRASRSAIDIEKELQQAVSGIVGPLKKKEPGLQREPDFKHVKEEFRQLRDKREPKLHGDRDIDDLLKDAISGLAGPPKKKVPEMPGLDRVASPTTEAPRPAPAVKPVPSAKPEGRTSPLEKIPVAEEIKQRLPFQPGKPNNIPRPAAQADIGRSAVPFDIDRTLIEIDKIPLEDHKPGRDEERSASHAAPGLKKKTLFEEFAEPARKKPRAAVIGAASAVLILTVSAAVFILKPKKPGAAPADNPTAVEESQASGAILRPDDAKTYPDTAEAELKPEPKRAAARPAPEPSAEIGAPILPAVNPRGMAVQIQEQPAANPAASSDTRSEAAAQTESLPPSGAPEPNPQESPAAPTETPSGQPAVEKARQGDLVALAQVDSPPVLTKKVEPKYPPIALRSGAAGTITVNALISEKGDVLRTEILRGIKAGFGLEDAAESAIRQWKFRPAVKDGASVRVWKSFDITFKPNIKNP